MEISEAELDIDMILDERGRELCGEWYRWTDLKRLGKLPERAMCSIHFTSVTFSLYNKIARGGILSKSPRMP
jgi:hypothetical protein